MKPGPEFFFLQWDQCILCFKKKISCVLWYYWISSFALPKYSNLILIFRFIVWIIGSNIQKKEKFLKVIIRKSQKLLTERALSELHGGGLFRTFNIAFHSISIMAGYVKRRTGYCLLRTPSPRGKQFVWFLKIDLFRFHRIYLLFDWSKLLFFLDVLINDKIYLIRIQICIILMLWTSVNVTLKKW